MPKTSLPTDPLFQYQWALLNTGQQGGHAGVDLNVIPVWGTGAGQVTGKGVRVAVVDDGTQLAHPDLVANIDVADSFDAVLDQAGGGNGNPNSATQSHGTAVAGIIGAAANGIGSVGVAPDATLIAIRIPLGNDDPLYVDGDPVDPVLPKMGDAILNGLAHALDARADVANNSWGSSAPFSNALDDSEGLGFVIKTLATQGRDGKGINIIKSNGNDRLEKAVGTLDGMNGSRRVIAVGAMDNNGITSSYSTPGANLLVTAPAGGSTSQKSDRPGTGIVTADRTGLDGYNEAASPFGDDAYNFNGTSAAAPFVSGVVALMLQANPDLGYRDVQQILAMSARKNDPTTTGWFTNAATGVNGGGMHFDTDYGFGLVDAHAAVRLSQSWAVMGKVAQTEANESSVSSTLLPGTPIAIGTGVPITITMGAGQVEHLDLNLGMVLGDLSRVSLVLKSPSGTVVRLLSAGLSPSTAWPGTFQLGVNSFWGEKTEGDWKLYVVPKQADGSSTGADPVSGREFNPGTVTGLTLTAWGGASATADQVVFTDDFALTAADEPGRTVIQAGPTTKTFNAAATSGTLALDLRHGIGAIGGRAFGVVGDADFTRVLGGDGTNLIFGDDDDHTYVTGHGQTTLAVGGGTAQVISQGQDTIFAGNGATAIRGSGTMLVVGGAGMALVAGQGGDTMFGGAGGGSFFAGSGGGSVLVGGAGMGGSTLVGGGNGDTLFATGAARTQLVAGAGNETLFGGAASGNNIFFGGSGSTMIVGGAGNDTIFVGTGSATVDGGAGTDLIVFAKGRAGGSVVINNLDPAKGSRLTLQGYAADELANGLSRAVAGAGAGGSVVTLSDNTRITFTGLQANAGMFV